jgi:hypothetical protein
MNKLMENNTLEYEYLYSNSRSCLNIDNDFIDNENEMKILFLSISQVSNFKARQAARQTYGKYLNKMNLKLIFFVGNPNYSQQPRNNELQVKIDKEIVENKDIVQINMPDNDNFTSAKTLIALRWSIIYCSIAQYLYVVTDSAIINYQLLSTLLYKTSLFGTHQQNRVEERYQKINSSVIAGYCNFTDEKLADALNSFLQAYSNKIKMQQLGLTKIPKQQQQQSSNDSYKGQYCSGLGWLVNKEAALKLWSTAFRSPYLVRIMPAYLTGYLGYKANLKHLHLFDYEEIIPFKSNCLKIIQSDPNKLLCAENFTMHNRYANYIATWNTGGQTQLVFSKL